MNIKFKGKRVDTGEWIEGYLYIDKDNEYKEHYYILNESEKIIVNEYGVEMPAFIEIIPESVTCNIVEGLKRDIINIDKKIKDSELKHNNHCVTRLKAFRTKSKEILKRLEEM